MVVVEVRQGTLGVDGRGWGPAENTVDRGSQLSKDDEDDEEDEEEEERRTRQDEAEEEEEKEEKEEEEKEDEEEDEEATDIKSNNPHLAGGEKISNDVIPTTWSFSIPFTGGKSISAQVNLLFFDPTAPEPRTPAHHVTREARFDWFQLEPKSNRKGGFFYVVYICLYMFKTMLICLKQCSEIYPQPVYDKIGSATKGVYPQAVQAFPRWIKGGSSRDLPRVSGKHDRFTAGFWTSILVMKWLSKLSWYGTRKWLL